MYRRLAAYGRTGNLEMLVDVANLCLLEFVEGRHPSGISEPWMIPRSTSKRRADPLRMSDPFAILFAPLLSGRSVLGYGPVGCRKASAGPFFRGHRLESCPPVSLHPGRFRACVGRTKLKRTPEGPPPPARTPPLHPSGPGEVLRPRLRQNPLRRDGRLPHLPGGFADAARLERAGYEPMPW